MRHLIHKSRGYALLVDLHMIAMISLHGKISLSIASQKKIVLLIDVTDEIVILQKHLQSLLQQLVVSYIQIINF